MIADFATTHPKNDWLDKHAFDQHMAAVKPHFSLIIPAYNEALTIENTLLQYVSYLDQQPYSYEIWVILNGCSDNTLEKVTAFSENHANIGWAMRDEADKGQAIKLGLQLSRGNLVGFVDADGQITVDEFSKLLGPLASSSTIDGFIGSKYVAPKNQEHTSAMRGIAGKAFSKLTTLVLGLPYADTQCGAKVFRREIVDQVLADLQLKGWAFDVELLYNIYQNGHLIQEVSIDIQPDTRPSQLNVLKTVPDMFWQLIRLRLKAVKNFSALLNSVDHNDSHKSKAAKKLGQILCEMNMLSVQELNQMLILQKSEGNGQKLGDLLFQQGMVDRNVVHAALAIQEGDQVSSPWMNPTPYNVALTTG